MKKATFITIGVAVICAVFLATRNDEYERHERSDVQVRQTARAQDDEPQASVPANVQYESLHSQHGDRYWIMGPDEPSDVLDVLIRQFDERVRRLLTQYRTASDLSQRIFERAEGMEIAVFDPRRMQAIFESGEPYLDHVLLMVVPAAYVENSFFTEQIGPYWMFMGFRPTKMVFIRAVECPDALLAAGIYHELGHAVRDLFPADFTPLSSIFEEEVVMHELGDDILDMATGGGVSGLMERIITRARPVLEQQRLVLDEIVRLEDLLEWDRLLQIEQNDRLPSMAGFVQFQLSLTFRIADQYFPPNPDDPRAHKVDLYRGYGGADVYRLYGNGE